MVHFCIHPVLKNDVTANNFYILFQTVYSLIAKYKCIYFFIRISRGWMSGWVFVPNFVAIFVILWCYSSLWPTAKTLKKSKRDYSCPETDIIHCFQVIKSTIFEQSKWPEYLATLVLFRCLFPCQKMLYHVYVYGLAYVLWIIYWCHLAEATSFLNPKLPCSRATQYALLTTKVVWRWLGLNQGLSGQLANALPLSWELGNKKYLKLKKYMFKI